MRPHSGAEKGASIMASMRRLFFFIPKALRRVIGTSLSLLGVGTIIASILGIFLGLYIVFFIQRWLFGWSEAIAAAAVVIAGFTLATFGESLVRVADMKVHSGDRHGSAQGWEAALRRVTLVSRNEPGAKRVYLASRWEPGIERVYCISHQEPGVERVYPVRRWRPGVKALYRVNP